MTENIIRCSSRFAYKTVKQTWTKANDYDAVDKEESTECEITQKQGKKIGMEHTREVNKKKTWSGDRLAHSPLSPIMSSLNKWS